MPDITPTQTHVLFELSNGKRLYVHEPGAEAFIGDPLRVELTQHRIPARFADFVRLRDVEYVAADGYRTLEGGRDVRVYGISSDGVEALLETSMRPVEE
jgi:hypothetical protein